MPGKNTVTASGCFSWFDTPHIHNSGKQWQAMKWRTWVKKGTQVESKIRINDCNGKSRNVQCKKKQQQQHTCILPLSIFLFCLLVCLSIASKCQEEGLLVAICVHFLLDVAAVCQANSLTEASNHPPHLGQQTHKPKLWNKSSRSQEGQTSEKEQWWDCIVFFLWTGETFSESQFAMGNFSIWIIYLVSRIVLRIFSECHFLHKKKHHNHTHSQLFPACWKIQKCRTFIHKRKISSYILHSREWIPERTDVLMSAAASSVSDKGQWKMKHLALEQRRSLIHKIYVPLQKRGEKKRKNGNKQNPAL